MIGRLKSTILLLNDNYPDYSTIEAEFIETTLVNEGYTVKKVSVKELLSIGGNFTCFYGQVLVVPNCSNLPLSVKTALKTYSESMGSVIYIGGPLFYNMVEANESGDFIIKPIENSLDANFNSEHPYIREGIAPSYKTFMVDNISDLRTSTSQNFHTDDVTLPKESSISIPCEVFHGIGYNSDSNCRFIPIVECYEKETEENAVDMGMRNGCRGSFAFIELENTIGDGYIGKINYGMVENTQVGSAVACIGYNDGIQNLIGGAQLLVDIVKRLVCGVYIFDGGAEGFRFLENEDITFGCNLMNTSNEFKKVICVFTIETDNGDMTYEEEKLLCPQFMSKLEFKKSFLEFSEFGIEFGKEKSISVKLYIDDKLIDWVDSFYSFENRFSSKNIEDYVTAKDDLFYLNNKPWYMAGMNYWPTYSPSREKKHYWMGIFDKSNYDVITIENDLSYMNSLGLNCVMIRVDFTNFDRITHGFRDFLIRCKKYDIKIGLGLTKITASKYYNSAALEEFIKRFDVANNPTIAFVDVEWESAWDHLSPRICPEFYDEWTDWIVNKYGSIKHAEKVLNVEFQYDNNDNIVFFNINEYENLKYWADVYSFINDCIDKYWSAFYPHIKERLPLQMITFRFGAPYFPGYAQASKFIDFSPMEVYDFNGFDNFKDPESRDNCVGLCVVSSTIQKYETGNKPIVWAEYGRSACGIKWHNTLFYDHMKHSYIAEEVNNQTLYNKYVQEAAIEGHCAGTAPWWWCGGFRWTEMADFGYVYPSGKLSESGKNYVEFCNLMKKRIKLQQEDTREEYIVEANIFNYKKGKDSFIKTDGIAAYKNAKRNGNKLVVKTTYNNLI